MTTGLIEGLAALKQYDEAEEKRRQERQTFQKVKYLQVPADISVELIFLQELSADSPRYSEKNWSGLLCSWAKIASPFFSL